VSYTRRRREEEEKGKEEWEEKESRYLNPTRASTSPLFARRALTLHPLSIASTPK